MVILLGLIFLLDRSTQDQTMKISFIFFLSIIPFNMHLQSSSKFLELLKSAGKRVFTPGTHVAPGEYPGVVSHCGLSGYVAHSDGVSEGLSARALGTRGELRRCLGGSLGASTRDTW